VGGRGVGQRADRDHVGVLVGGGVERIEHARRVDSDLALVDDRALVGVDHLHRLLDGHDVAAPGGVHVVDHRCQRRRAPRPGESAHEHQPRRRLREPGRRLGQPEGLERRHARHDPAQHQAHEPPLAEAAHPEAAQALHRVHGVGLVSVAELVVGSAQQEPCRVLGVGRLHDLERRLDQRAVDPHVRARPHLQVDVGRALLHREPQQPIEIQHTPGIDTPAPGLDRPPWRGPAFSAGGWVGCGCRGGP